MNFLSKLKSGLSKSSGKLGQGITGIFTQARLDATSLEALEELLIEADLGAKTAAELTAALSQRKFDKAVTPQEVREFLAGEMTRILAPVAVPLLIPPLAGGQRGVNDIEGGKTITPPSPPASGGAKPVPPGQ